MVFKIVTVGTSTVRIADYNEARLAIFIQNRGDNDVFISENQTDAFVNGVVLRKFDSLSRIKMLGANVEYALYARTLVGTSDVVIIEDFQMYEG